MSHILDPIAIDSHAAYLAARRELDDLLAAEPLDAAGTRATELLHLIDAYEARDSGNDIARMRRLLASSR